MRLSVFRLCVQFTERLLSVFRLHYTSIAWHRRSTPGKASWTKSGKVLKPSNTGVTGDRFLSCMDRWRDPGGDRSTVFLFEHHSETDLLMYFSLVITSTSEGIPETLVAGLHDAPV